MIVSARLTGRQEAFIDFVLLHDVRVGVEEPGTDKLTPLLRLNYRNSSSDAIADLGGPAEISGCFVDFQRWLYTAEAV